jgi:hypothetical protein
MGVVDIEVAMVELGSADRKHFVRCQERRPTSWLGLKAAGRQ